MIKIDYKFFSNEENKEIEVSIIANSELDCLKIINKNFPIENRLRNNKEDSLIVLNKEETKYFIVINNRII